MGIFENYMVFIIFAMATITLVACNDIDQQEFYEELLKLHNEVREIHQAQPLKLSEELAKEAMDFLIDIIEERVQLSVLYWQYHVIILPGVDNINAKKLFYSMYNEGKLYNYEMEAEEKYAINFTQIVWKATDEVGFAFICKDQTYYYSAVYRPVGNVTGQYKDNIERPIIPIEEEEEEEEEEEDED